jgi:hypothetical protein
VLGHFAAPAPPVQSEINWDPWYRDLISESCQTWATVERLPGKVDLLVTVRCDGQIECLAAPSPKAPTKISPSAQITAAQNKEMLARATVSINAMSQQAVTHFPAASKRKSVSFEMELVSTATDVAKFTDACKPDIEHVASLRSTAQLNQGAMPYELLEEKRLSWTSKLAEERKPGIIWFLVQSI